jgi:hypothetical protein
MTLDLNPFSCFLLPPSHSIVAEPSVFSFPCGAQIMESEVIPHLLPYEEEKPKIIAVSRPPPPPLSLPLLATYWAGGRGAETEESVAEPYR